MPFSFKGSVSAAWRSIMVSACRTPKMVLFGSLQRKPAFIHLSRPLPQSGSMTCQAGIPSALKAAKIPCLVLHVCTIDLNEQGAHALQRLEQLRTTPWPSLPHMAHVHKPSPACQMHVCVCVCISACSMHTSMYVFACAHACLRARMLCAFMKKWM